MSLIGTFRQRFLALKNIREYSIAGSRREGTEIGLRLGDGWPLIGEVRVEFRTGPLGEKSSGSHHGGGGEGRLGSPIQPHPSHSGVNDVPQWNHLLSLESH